MRTSGSGGPSAGKAQGGFFSADDLGDMSREMLEKLRGTIEVEIIPRLMLALDTTPTRATPTPAEALDPADSLEEFVQLLLAHDAPVANKYVAALRSKGVPLASLYLDLLAPAARRLGAMWEADEVSFVDVTLGLCRMHEVLLEFSRCFDARGHRDGPGRNALIVPAPGEQHTFGLFMVMEFFRRDGWNCFTGTPHTAQEFKRLVRIQEYDAIGISVSATRHLDAAADQISEIRRLPRGKQIVVLAGGRAFLDDPDLATRIGADAMAIDARDGVQKVNDLWQRGRRNTSS
jgi:methanogenic corrinoid protein MtbC1